MAHHAGKALIKNPFRIRIEAIDSCMCCAVHFPAQAQEVRLLVAHQRIQLFRKGGRVPNGFGQGKQLIKRLRAAVRRAMVVRLASVSAQP